MTMDYKFQTVFTKTDRLILSRHSMMADAIAKLIGSHCEVVVHSLEELDHSVIKIVNGYISGRSAGAPLTNLCFDIIRNSEQTKTDIVGPYYSLSSDGRTTRSITTIIRGENEKIIGLICFNMDLSCPFDSIMREYIGAPSVQPSTISEIYPHTLEELIHHLLSEAITAANQMKCVSALERNLAAIQLMSEKGVFNFKGAADIVAHEMGISRTTVYNYLRDSRVMQEQN